jgi:hypothetical protein
MARSKYKQYFEKMVSENKKLFDDFTTVHFEYSANPELNQDAFNKKGERVLEVVRDYENKLCKNTERGVYSKFSGNLAQKFHDEIKKHFPLIDHIGLKAEKEKVFSIKKISL